jgi:hypothetical protein
MSVGHHVGVVIVRLSHYLIDDELKISVDVKPLNPKFSGDAQTVDQGLIICHIIGCVEVQPNNIKESISFRRDQHCASPGTVEGKRAIKIHSPMPLSDRGWLLSLSPFSHKVCQGLGIDRCLGYVGYVEPHELECPLGDPSCGATVLKNFSKPK